MSLLAFEDVGVRYGARMALGGVSFGVAPGEVVALVGASGSGKSTLALAVLGLLEAEVGGRVLVDGVDIAGLDARALRALRGGRIGIVFQEPASALNPALTIARQIGEAVAAHRPGVNVAAEVVALLARVGLDVAPTRHPHSLSGGQRQRVAIAMAIAGEPALLIADEPTAALDPIARAHIVELLIGLVRERGMALLLISHDLALGAAIADRLVVLANGRIVEDAPARTALAAPVSAELQAQVAALHSGPRVATVPGTPVLTLQDVTHRYTSSRRGNDAKVALDDVSFVIGRGETVGVIGESGSGKSTLARLALGLEAPDAGTIRREGSAFAVFQDPATSFDPRWTVARIVAEPLRERLSADERDARVAAALAEVGLPSNAADRLPSAFSGGQRQRIAIARALIARPALVVLDEAVSALDPLLRREMLMLLAEIQRRHGTAFLFIAHDMALVRGFTDRLVVLRDGRVIAAGPTAVLMDDPPDVYAAALLAEPVIR